MFTSEPHLNYDHIHRVSAPQLPRVRRTDSRVTTRGYAVGMGGLLPQIWVFFAHLEPAYAFGRAGRMASTGDVTGFGVFEAVHEVRWVEDEDGRGRDVRTLHLALENSLNEHADDQAVLARWIQGVVPRTAYFQPPGTRGAGTAAQ
jgi:hypothetical protein